MKTLFEAEDNYYVPNCTTLIPPYIPTKEYEVEAMITDCFMNSLLYALNAEGDLKASLSNAKTTTDNVNLIIKSGNIWDSFEKNQTCIYTISTHDPAPTMTIKNTTANHDETS